MIEEIEPIIEKEKPTITIEEPIKIDEIIPEVVTEKKEEIIEPF